MIKPGNANRLFAFGMTCAGLAAASLSPTIGGGVAGWVVVAVGILLAVFA